MNVLVMGGTRFFGVYLVKSLLEAGHTVTIATRGQRGDGFGEDVGRIIVDRTDENAMKKAFDGKYFDVVCDNICYCANDLMRILDSCGCGRYVLTSTSAVYDRLVPNTKEDDFKPEECEEFRCEREDFDYGKVKRSAEIMLFKKYSRINACAVRFPVVIGKEDHTRRFAFYVDAVKNGTPFYCDNADNFVSKIDAETAGNFLAFMAENDFCGSINAACDGTFSIGEIIDKSEEKYGRKAVRDKNGAASPYNGEPDFWLNTEKAKALGFVFPQIRPIAFGMI